MIVHENQIQKKEIEFVSMPNAFTKYFQIVVFDVETTGFDYRQDEIIDFGAVVLEPSEDGFLIVEEINHLVKTFKPIEAKITELTGIMEEMVMTGISPQELARIIQRLFTPDTLFVAYNLQFDISFVDDHMRRYAENFPFSSDILDLMVVYKDNHDYPHRLENALSHYGIQIEHAHRAFDDALATAKLLKALSEETDTCSYINHIGYHEKYGLKGVTFDHVRYHPQSYMKGSLRERIRKESKKAPHRQ